MKSRLEGIKNTQYYIFGDINIDLLTYDNNIAVCDYVNMLYCSGVKPLITKPTRITETTATLIDHIYTNDVNLKTAGILIFHISDHLPVYKLGKSSKATY